MAISASCFLRTSTITTGSHSVWALRGKSLLWCLHVHRIDTHQLTGASPNLGDSFGDRSTNVQLQRIRRGLEKWLSSGFGGRFKDFGNTLPTGRQTDGHSCGVCVINAMEHAIFGVPLFADRDHYRLHVRYFVGVTKYLLDNVGPVSRQKQSHLPLSS